MATTSKPFRLDDGTLRMLSELAKNQNTTKTDIVKTAIEEMYNGGTPATKRVSMVYDLVSEQIQQLEIIRDHMRDLTDEEKELYKFLNKMWDGLRGLEAFWEPSYPEMED